MKIRSSHIAIVCSLISVPVAAQSAGDFYANKQVRFIIGYDPGGGFDAYGRILANFIGQYIPGRPKVVVINMPGAGSLKSVQYMLKEAPRDGTTFGIFNEGLIGKSIASPEAVGVDFRKLTYIGNMYSGSDACFSWRATGIRTVDDIRKSNGITLGATLGSGLNNLFAALFPGKVKLINGYTGLPDIWLAAERGELDSFCSPVVSTEISKQQWVRENTIAPLVEFALKKNDDPFLKDAPLAQDLATSQDLKNTILFLTGVQSLSRPVAGPPDLPADRIEVLRKAFLATFENPEFIASARKAMMEMGPMTGQQTADFVGKLYETPQETRDLARKLSPD